MALAALLLFKSDWDDSAAKERFTRLVDIGKARDLEAGNVIGMNPFIHFDAWLVVKKIAQLSAKLPANDNLDTAFAKEKTRLTAIYFPES